MNYETKTTKSIVKEFIWEFVKILVISLAIVVPVRYFLIQPFYVKGASMEPNFHDHEYLIIDQISFRFSEPQRGEVIVFRSPYNWHDYFIKRVIGLPGERIEVKDGEVYLHNNEFKNGTKIDESEYLFPGTRTPGQIDFTLNEDEFFVLGDNRNSSLDSRSFGPVLRQRIVGRAWLRGWPFSRISKFNIPIYTFR